MTSPAKLYHVVVSIELVVEASDPRAAREAAVNAVAYDGANLQTESLSPGTARRIRSRADVPSGWLGACPWGGDGGLSVREILDGDP